MNREYHRIKAGQKELDEKADRALPWSGMTLPETAIQGDMPGDKIEIGEEHRKKADIIFPLLLEGLKKAWRENPYGRSVAAVCGGSGVGKSEIASLIGCYLKQIGIGSYTLSGDNYPHRIPKYNDAERLRIFRESGIRGLVDSGGFTGERFAKLREWQNQETDADPSHLRRHPWMQAYQDAGRKGLESYLGTRREIDFDEIEQIVSAFRDGADKIWLRRMGREETALWYEKVDFSEVQVLLIEWTHGNSERYKGVDFPILLNSTPQETLAHRRARNRDQKTDGPFTLLVLQIEQEMLHRQASRARLILSKDGEALSYEAYLAQMKESGVEELG